MALINPCETCQVPQLLRRVSAAAEGLLPKMQEGDDELIERAQDPALPANYREKMLAAVANAAVFTTEVHNIAERTNSQSCESQGGDCRRALFAMDAISTAIGSAYARIQQQLRDGGEPPQSPQVPPQPSPTE